MKVFSNSPTMSFWPRRCCRGCCPCCAWLNSPPRISSQFGPQTILSICLPVIRLRGRAVGAGLHLRRALQVVVVEGEGLVVVVDLRQVGVGEDAHQQLPLAALARLDAAVGLAHPAAVPLVLVLPLLRVADAGLGLDVVEPGVFHAGAAGPDVLAGDANRCGSRCTCPGSAPCRFVRGLSCVFSLRLDEARRALRRPACPASRSCPSCAPRRTRRGWCRWCRSS